MPLKRMCKKGLHPLAGDNIYEVPTTGKQRCRACMYAYQREYYQQKDWKRNKKRRDYMREYKRSYMREWRRQHPEKIKIAQKKCTEKSKLSGKFWAQHAINALIRHGYLVRPEKCERCAGRFPNKPHKGLVAHHEDYSKPLDVVWLCRKCHGARHRELNDAKVRP